MMMNSWRWVGLTTLTLALGCTGSEGNGSSGLVQELELAAAPSIALDPIVTTIPLDLWFTPMALEIGDFDGDGATDLLVSGVEPGVGVTAGVFLGNGSGEFESAIETGFTACSAFPVTGDLDSDGRTDVVALGCDSNLAVYMGQPDGTLAPWSRWPDPSYTPVSSSVIADFERDGDNDLVTLRIPGESFIDIALGNGSTGIWSVETTEIGNPEWSGFDPGGMALGYFNEDRLLDVALIEREHDVVTMMAAPPATFGFPIELGVEIPPWSNRVGDMDGDGLDDLVISSYTSPSMQILVSDGDGDFFSAEPVEFTTFAPYDTALGDLDGDGNLDVAMVDDSVGELHWFQGSGNGRLGDEGIFELPSPAIRIHAGQIDGDGVEDLVAATFDDDSLTLVLSNG